MLNKWRLIQVNPERCCLLTDDGRRGRGKCRRCHGNELYAVLTEYFSPASTYEIHASIRDPGPSNSFYFTDHTQPSLMTDAVSEALIDSQDPGRHTRTRVLLFFLSVIVKNIQHVSIVSCSTIRPKQLWDQQLLLWPFLYRYWLSLPASLRNFTAFNALCLLDWWLNWSWSEGFGRLSLKPQSFTNQMDVCIVFVTQKWCTWCGFNIWNSDRVCQIPNLSLYVFFSPTL